MKNLSYIEMARMGEERMVCKPGIATERNAVRLGFFLAYCKAIMFLPGEGLEPAP